MKSKNHVRNMNNVREPLNIYLLSAGPWMIQRSQVVLRPLCSEWTPVYKVESWEGPQAAWVESASILPYSFSRLWSTPFPVDFFWSLLLLAALGLWTFVPWGSLQLPSPQWLQVTSNLKKVFLPDRDHNLWRIDLLNENNALAGL